MHGAWRLLNPLQSLCKEGKTSKTVLGRQYDFTYMKLFTAQDFSRQSAVQTCWTRRGNYDLNWAQAAAAVAQIPVRDFFAFDSTSLGSGSGCSDAVTASIKYSTGIDCGRGAQLTLPHLHPDAPQHLCHLSRHLWDSFGYLCHLFGHLWDIYGHRGHFCAYRW